MVVSDTSYMIDCDHYFGDIGIWQVWANTKMGSAASQNRAKS